MADGLKSLNVSPRRQLAKGVGFRNPEAGEFRDSEVGFFLSADTPAFVSSHRPAEWDPAPSCPDQPLSVPSAAGGYHNSTALQQSARSVHRTG
ncbi:hypothetical protein HFO88_06555 [Rhizobium leguminosarum]|uniref:hypothetical protein n=1 Tax=Rhizobium leguminosarum TaxID=384 RepID=UPI001C979F3A|nr:hypothetical protein [Rhizobium leguminosarum]MBY5899994.1 hypothetical protein [Rhizobium leguminosarum]MBY5906196.1 hypothetical protein [Rhizobium leguminosarum]